MSSCKTKNDGFGFLLKLASQKSQRIWCKDAMELLTPAAKICGENRVIGPW
jgi:hypothetical protein